MTEAEWSASTDPEALLALLRDRVSERKLRLFACACARRVWHQLGEDSEEVDVSERFADGRSSRTELKAARSRLGARGGYSAAWAANNAQFAVLEEVAEVAARRGVKHAADFVYFFTQEQNHAAQPGDQGPAFAARDAERRSLALMIRDVFGNPFRSAFITPSDLTPTISSIAQAAYEERVMPSGELDQAWLAVLADALEDAGAVGGLLAHLRSPGPHVRGCWALDLVLGKE